ncbi:hypothetical protein FOZ62_020506 [Perkinsus olseni]|uniref:Uncharacterized protein n=1 Tax=Perkinsus olseni TaxID=32597 RepID=A0A7J6RI94_PEROL|nr:hypothetical protein FOZ62_020506 [Perkinsus olseni]
MRTSMLAWLISAQVVVIILTSAQDVRRFLHDPYDGLPKPSVIYTMAYEVSDYHKLTLKIDVTGARTDRGNATVIVDDHLSLGPCLLEEGTSKGSYTTYCLKFDGSSEPTRDDWYDVLDTFLMDNGIIGSDEEYADPDSDDDWDLTVLRAELRGRPAKASSHSSLACAPAGRK